MEQEPIVVNKKKSKYTQYIGRGSIFGNPFIIGIDGNRNEVCDKYGEYARAKPELIEAIRALPKNAVLGCFCKPFRCHGEEIIKIWRELQLKNRN